MTLAVRSPAGTASNPHRRPSTGIPIALTASRMACRRGRATWLVRGTSPRGPLTPVTRVRPGELRPHKDVLTACMGVRGSHAIGEGRPQGGESAPPAGLGRIPRQRTLPSRRPIPIVSASALHACNELPTPVGSGVDRRPWDAGESALLRPHGLYAAHADPRGPAAIRSVQASVQAVDPRVSVPRRSHPHPPRSEP